MKLVIKTKHHFGDHNIHQQGVQFEAYFIHSPTDTMDDLKAMHELSNIVRADCKEAGWYYGFGKYAEGETNNGRHSGGGPAMRRSHLASACSRRVWCRLKILRRRTNGRWMKCGFAW